MAPRACRSLRRGSHTAAATTGHKASVAVASDLVARTEFLTAMSNFRPKETIFEARASAGGSTTAGQVDKGRNTGGVRGKGDTQSIMKSMRREMKVVRNKGSLVVAGSEVRGVTSATSVKVLLL